MVQNMFEDENWWNQVKKNERRLGFGSLNKFIVEMKMIHQNIIDGTNENIQKKIQEIIQKISDIYRASHPEKKDILAGKEWIEEYMKACQQKIQQHLLTCTTTTIGTN
jgi:hypothetical protein